MPSHGLTLTPGSEQYVVEMLHITRRARAEISAPLDYITRRARAEISAPLDYSVEQVAQEESKEEALSAVPPSTSEPKPSKPGGRLRNLFRRKG